MRMRRNIDGEPISFLKYNKFSFGEVPMKKSKRMKRNEQNFKITLKNILKFENILLGESRNTLNQRPVL